jgi:hypothetical protein
MHKQREEKDLMVDQIIVKEEMEEDDEEIGYPHVEELGLEGLMVLMVMLWGKVILRELLVNCSFPCMHDEEQVHMQLLQLNKVVVNLVVLIPEILINLEMVCVIQGEVVDGIVHEGMVSSSLDINSKKRLVDSLIQDVFSLCF